MNRDDFSFFHTVRVRWSDVDLQGVVSSGTYLDYYDIGIIELFRHLEYDYPNQAQNTGTDFYTAKTLVEYKMWAGFDDLLDIAVEVSRLGRSSLSFSMAIFQHERDDLIVEGEVVWVNVDLKTYRPCPIPAELGVRLRERFPALVSTL
jgi:acyl-CoA thioester hydrolase